MENVLICEYVFKGRPIVKKNTSYKYKGRHIYSKRFQKWLDKAILELRIQKTDFTIIDYPVFAEYEFYFKNAQAEPDTSNLVEAIPDLLEKENIIKNDKLIIGFTAIKIIGDECPRSTVKLYKCNFNNLIDSWTDFKQGNL